MVSLSTTVQADRCYYCSTTVLADDGVNRTMKEALWDVVVDHHRPAAAVLAIIVRRLYNHSRRCKGKHQSVSGVRALYYSEATNRISLILSRLHFHGIVVDQWQCPHTTAAAAEITRCRSFVRSCNLLMWTWRFFETHPVLWNTRKY